MTFFQFNFIHREKLHEPKSNVPFPTFSIPIRKNDEFFMQLAYNEAITALENDEVPVGAVTQIIMVKSSQLQIIKQENVKTQPLTQRCWQSPRRPKIGDWRLNDCTMYVTKEPCPMCTGASVVGRIKKYYLLLVTPKWGD